MDYKALGNSIRIRRKALGLTQEAVAQRTGITAPFLGHIERGSRIPSLETALRIVDALDTTPNQLFAFCTYDELSQSAIFDQIEKLLRTLRAKRLR